MHHMHTGPVGYPEQYVCNSQFVIVFFWITGWTKAYLPWEKGQPVGLVESAHKNLLKEVSGYCTRVHKRHARTRFRGPFKHSIQQPSVKTHRKYKHECRHMVPDRVFESSGSVTLFWTLWCITRYVLAEIHNLSIRYYLSNFKNLRQAAETLGLTCHYVTKLETARNAERHVTIATQLAVFLRYFALLLHRNRLEHTGNNACAQMGDCFEYFHQSTSIYL